MPARKSWLLRVTEIREQLEATQVPVVDRTMFERLFGVRRRRAIQLMSFFGGFQAGRTFLVDRLDLIRQLAPVEASTEFAVEQQRRQRLTDALEKVRRLRLATRVALPVAKDAFDRRVEDLPDGIQLQPGCLHVEFHKAEELLAKLFELSKAAANDFEAFRGAVEAH